jgi:hypothetical protein
MERFNLKNLNDVKGKEQFRFEVSNRLAAVEDLDTEVFLIPFYLQAVQIHSANGVQITRGMKRSAQ